VSADRRLGDWRVGLALTASVLAASACGSRMDERPPDRSERIRSDLDALVARSKTPGIQYLVVDSTTTLFEYDGGWADVGRRIPMDPATTLMAYSMSKTLTAVAVLRLVAAGRVGLDDPVSRYVDSLPYAGVTIRQLLAHTSGIPNPIPLRWVHLAARHDSFDERAALTAVLRRYPRLSFPPGTKYAYSNIGYWLLGPVVERASGRPFTSYVEEQVLAPLGIAPSELGYTIPDPAHHATGYLEKYSFMNLAKRFLIDREFIGAYDGRWLRIESHYPNGPAFGGLVGTARGFGKFLRDQLRDHSALLDRPDAGAPVRAAAHGRRRRHHDDPRLAHRRPERHAVLLQGGRRRRVPPHDAAVPRVGGGDGGHDQRDGIRRDRLLEQARPGVPAVTIGPLDGARRARSATADPGPSVRPPSGGAPAG
jgi:D-alanyl-D-alanine carboxypeptidase